MLRSYNVYLEISPIDRVVVKLALVHEVRLELRSVKHLLYSHVSRIVTLHFKLQNLSTKSGYETCLKRNREILLNGSSTIQKVGILFLKGILMLCEYKLLRPCTRRALWLTFFHARHSFHLWLWVIWEAKVWTLISLCYAATLNSWKMYKPLYWQSTKWLQ